MPAPLLFTVSAESPPSGVDANYPAPIDIQGGSVLVLVTENVVASELEPFVTVEFLTGGPGLYVVHARGHINTPARDVSLERVFVATPALEPGLYHVRVTTEEGVSNVEEDAVLAQAFAERHKVLATRAKWASAWDTGPRRLR